jgi:anti-sigma regulatory factor (Ser/Thr protein kinase)
MQLLVNRLKFAATLTAPGCARVFVNHTLKSWLLADRVDDAEAIVTELVTNAVQATGITDPHPTYADLERMALLGVQVRVSGSSLFIEVWDDDRETPDSPPAADTDPDERGRGFVIVRGLSVHYGVSSSRRGGKVVWAQMDAGAEIATVPQFQPTPLPRGYRRVVFSEARQPNEHAVADLALMDRITHPPYPARRAG